MRVAALLILALLLLAPAANAGESVLPDVEDEVMCPVCGTTLELANGPQADRERALIRRLDEEGLSKEGLSTDQIGHWTFREGVRRERVFTQRRRLRLSPG